MRALHNPLLHWGLHPQTPKDLLKITHNYGFFLRALKNSKLSDLYDSIKYKEEER